MAQVTSRHRQAGETLLLTLGVLVVLLLGFLFVSRHIMSDAQMAGNNLARQKNVQVADVAMSNLSKMILDAYGGQRLEDIGAGLPWFRTVAANTVIPESYWATCLGASAATTRCGNVPVTVNGTALPYTALAVVQTTGRQPESDGCLQNFAAYYYDVFIHTVESSGVTSATTETVYKLCVYDPNSNR